jgi:hypothetical protein
LESEPEQTLSQIVFVLEHEWVWGVYSIDHGLAPPGQDNSDHGKGSNGSQSSEDVLVAFFVVERVFVVFEKHDSGSF